MMNIVISTTTKTREEARKISSACVSKGIAACAHIQKLETFYYWDGGVHEGTEYRVDLKSTELSYNAVASEIRAHHNYIEPAIMYTHIAGGSSSYLQWIQDNSARD